MKKASITEAKNGFSALIDEVQHGETVLILDRGRPVARLESIVAQGVGEDAEGRLARLERAALVKRARSRPAKWVLNEPPPRAQVGASILRGLLEERNEAP